MARRVVGIAWIAVALALTGLPVPAQAEDRRPISHLSGPHSPLAAIELWQAPAFDYRAAAAEPIVKGEAVQVGRPFPVDVTTSNAGDWEALADGGRVWRMRFASAGALWLVLGFDRFQLPAGATLYVVGQDGKQVQTYTSDDVQPHGQLWTAPLPGDELVVELHWPRDLGRQDPGLHLAHVSHGYRPFGAVGREATDKAFGDSGSCNIDVVCPQADAWRDEIRGAMLILRNGSAQCSGSLINNTALDCTNYVLTANHCFSPSSGPTMSFQFNFERPGCGTGTPGPAQIVTGGAQFHAASSGSDFYLAEILGTIPDSFNPYYNGWSRTTSAGTESTGIHHPRGDAKKIAFNTDALVSSGSYWRVTEWEQGTTEGGSSGSPLFNQDRLIVGQLFGGFASCSARDEWDEYGKLSESWEGGGTPATRLRDRLDPGASGVVTLPGIDVSSCGAGAALVTLEQSAVDDAAGGNADGIIDSGESVALLVDATNSGSVDATQVVGTLTTSTPGVNIPVPTANFPDLAAGASATSLAPHFVIETDLTFECGTTIDLNVSLTAAEAAFPSQNPLSLPTGLEEISVYFVDTIEQGSADWTTQSDQGSAPWTLTSADSFSPTTSWFVPDTAVRNDQFLLLDPIGSLPANVVLSFHHRYNTEADWDGGVLEYQVNGGSWLDAGSLITVGGYAGPIRVEAASNLAGRNAWHGSNNGWTEVRADLSSLAGHSVGLRWRLASDTSVSAEGWYIDDVQLISVTHVCNSVEPGEAAGPGGGAQFTIQIVRGLFDLDWSAPASGAPPTGYRLYATPLAAPYAPTCEAELGSATGVVLSQLSDNSGFLIVAFNAAGEGSYGTDSAGAERPPASGADVCP